MAQAIRSLRVPVAHSEVPVRGRIEEDQFMRRVAGLPVTTLDGQRIGHVVEATPTFYPDRDRWTIDVEGTFPELLQDVEWRLTSFVTRQTDDGRLIPVEVVLGLRTEPEDEEPLNTQLLREISKRLGAHRGDAGAGTAGAAGGAPGLMWMRLTHWRFRRALRRVGKAATRAAAVWRVL